MPSMYEYGLVPTAPILPVTRGYLLSLKQCFLTGLQAVIPKTQVFMALFTWGFCSYPLVTNHQTDFFFFLWSEIS